MARRWMHAPNSLGLSCVMCGEWGEPWPCEAEKMRLRSEAQDTAASSGLPSVVDITGVDAIARAVLRPVRDAVKDAIVAGGPPVALGGRILAILDAALAHSTPEEAWASDGDMLDRANEALRERWTQPDGFGEIEPDATPEPSLRDALAAAIHKTEHPAVHDCRVGLNMEPRPEWAGQRKCVLDAERLIAALPGLSLSAQPSEPRETVP